jgi:hypothetical protein
MEGQMGWARSKRTELNIACHAGHSLDHLLADLGLHFSFASLDVSFMIPASTRLVPASMMTSMRPASGCSPTSAPKEGSQLQAPRERLLANHGE